MRGQSKRRNCREAYRLADKPAPHLMKHQRKLAQAKSQTAGIFRHEDAQPPEVCRLLQPLL